MKHLAAFFMPVLLLAQEPAPKPAAESPAPVVEQAFTGSAEFGYRWLSDVGGSFDSYRSIVNLGEGPKLFGLDFTVNPPNHRFFDRMDVQANGWGGDPYSTGRLAMRKQGRYDFSFDYRNLAYFNFLPSFANVTGFDQRAFDIHRRLGNMELELRPGKSIIPYFGYTRDSGSGTGITDFVGDVNEYPVRERLRDQTDLFRGGLRFEYTHFHITLEQGGARFKDDQHVFTSDRNAGNRSTPFLDESLSLDRLDQAYGVRGNSVYSKALFTASPLSWLDLYAQFLFSQPHNDVNYSQNNVGRFVNLNSLLFFNEQQVLASSTATQPHSSANFGLELRPVRRLRITESWTTDRLHDASAGRLTGRILPAVPLVSSFGDRLGLNYNQQQVQVIFDLTRQLTLRGGHRFVWGDLEVRSPQAGFETGELRRQVGLAGLTFQPAPRLSLNVDFEGASGARSYFRTSLGDYQRLRIRGRYQISAALTVSTSLSLLNNRTPGALDYNFLNRDNSVSVNWHGKRMGLLADYTRSSLRSDLNYIVPSTRDIERSFYRDNAHAGSALIELERWRGKLSVGGTLFVSSGSRPTSYYQPLVRIAFPIQKSVSWLSEWRWYGFGERFYTYEGFRAHQFVIGLRISQ
jgi:hypothetical protein